MSHVDDGALHAYLDGELPPVERERVDTHLKGCPACQARLAEERALIERANKLLGAAAPPERAVPPLQQLRQPRLIWRLRRPLAWAATVTIAIGLGWYARGSLPTGVAPTSTAETALRETAPAAPVAAPSTPTAPATRSEQESKDHVSLERDADRELTAARRRGTANNAVALGQAAPTPPPIDSVKLDAAAARPRAAPAPSIRGGRAEPAPAPAADAVVSGMVVIDGAAKQAVTPVASPAWPIMARQTAHDVLGVDPVIIPGFAVRAYRRNPGAPEIVVEQITDAGTAISLIEWRADSSSDRRVDVAALNEPRVMAKSLNERLARFVGSLRVEIAGPLTPDSLSRLLELAR